MSDFVIDLTDGSEWLTRKKTPRRRVVSERAKAGMKANVAKMMERVREKAKQRQADRKAKAAFCPTGKGGGVVDNSCGSKDGGGKQLANDEPLKGLPQKPVNVAGYGPVTPAPLPKARQAAIDYMRSAGLPYDPPKEYVKVDKERAARIAAAYDQMKHDPQDPKVKASYEAMAKETIAQYQAVKATGLKVEFIDYQKDGDPYAASPRLATEDVKNNNHLWVFATADGFGSNKEFDPLANPLLADSGEVISGKHATVNDVFRVVHDYFGHIKEGNGFRADGEENAWRSHAAMFSDLARGAMTSETRGQNSWVNYGPHGESNRTASSAETVFADQKTGLLPDWATTDGAK